MKKIFFVFFLSVFLFACTNTKQGEILSSSGEKKKKIQVETSIIPLASLSNYIGGDFVEAKSLVPAGVSPHGFDIKPEQMIQVQEADLIIYLHLDHIDGFLDKALKNKDTLVVSEGIQFIEGIEHKHEEEHHEEENHSLDPHIWTSSQNAIIIAEKITQKLSEIAPQNKTYFENNLLSLKEELKKIKDEFFANTKGKEAKEFIIFHDAYNYLFDEISLDINKKIIFQKTILSDPNSAEMKNLIDAIKTYKIKVALREPQLNDSNLQKLASEYNLVIDSLDPLGTDSSRKGYLQNYKNNLLKLQKIYE